MMKTVVVTTDVFRCREFGLLSVANNARWLFGLTNNSFARSGFKQQIVVSESDRGQFRAGEYRRSHGLPMTSAAWASLVNTEFSVQDAAFFSDMLGAQLVIGWGLTPALIQMLDRNRVAFVDVEVDPIRFSDDIFLRVRTNNEGLSRYFAMLHLEEAIFQASVAAVRGFVSRKDATTTVEGRSLAMFAGQCEIDLSVVKSGRLVKSDDFLEDVQAIADTVDVFVIKPHPYDNNSYRFDGILRAIPNARISRSNIYRILSDINLKHVVALSSSVLDEADAFQIENTRLIAPDRDASHLLPTAMSSWYRIPAESLADGRLSDVFLGSAPVLPNLIGRKVDLRRSLDIGWSYSTLHEAKTLQLVMEAKGARGPQLKDKLMTRRSVAHALRMFLTSIV